MCQTHSLGAASSPLLYLYCVLQFHLHGQHFWLVGQGLGNYTDSVELNLVNPPLRDTATVPKGGYIVVRFLVSHRQLG